jgi:hypothetical protein
MEDNIHAWGDKKVFYKLINLQRKDIIKIQKEKKVIQQMMKKNKKKLNF